MDILISTAEIQNRVAELGKQISSDYQGKKLTIITVMTGGMIFAADLVRAIEIPVWLDSVSVASYSGTQSCGTLTFRSKLKMPVKGREVLLVDEVFDSGCTLQALRNRMLEEGASGVRTAVAVVKDVSRKAGIILPEYTAFTLPNRFLMGYGMDYDEDGRNQPYISALD